MVKWNSVCSSVHGVMSELLLAAELGALSKADFFKLTTKLYTQVNSTPPASKSPAPNMDLGAQDQKKNPKSEGLQWDLRT